MRIFTAVARKGEPMVEICGDNRFELIDKYKRKLIEATNIETAPDEMAVLDDILFRFWQMGWLDKLEQRWIPVSKPPEEDGTYLVYAPDYTGGSSSAKEWHDGVMFSKFKNGKWSIEHGYHKRPNCVKAHMPLPEPYRGDS